MLKPIKNNVLCEIIEEKSVIIVEKDVFHKHLEVVSVGEETTIVKKGQRIWLRPETKPAQIKIKNKEFIVVSEDDILCVE